jgi:hypothetical protein
MKDGQTFGQWLNWDFKTNGSLKIVNKNGALLYYECSDGYWDKREYDLEGRRIYYEDSKGLIMDNRTSEVEVIELNGRKYQLIP